MASLSEMSDYRDLDVDAAGRTPLQRDLDRLKGKEARINDGMHLPTDKKARKAHPMTRGLIDYFSDALYEVAGVSFVANEQHNPGQEMHWSWGKSNDHSDCIPRHLADRGTFDDDGLRHSAKLAWRALALLQEELVAEGLANKPRAAR